MCSTDGACSLAKLSDNGPTVERIAIIQQTRNRGAITTNCEKLHTDVSRLSHSTFFVQPVLMNLPAVVSGITVRSTHRLIFSFPLYCIDVDVYAQVFVHAVIPTNFVKKDEGNRATINPSSGSASLMPRCSLRFILKWFYIYTWTSEDTSVLENAINCHSTWKRRKIFFCHFVELLNIGLATMQIREVVINLTK